MVWAWKKLEEHRNEVLLWLVVFLYLLSIALRRGTYGAETSLSFAEIAVFTIIPLLAGLWSRNRVGMVGGLLVASMVPFQKTIASVFVLGVLVLLPIVLRSEVRQRLFTSDVARRFALFLAYLVLLWLFRLGGNTDLWSLPLLMGSAFAIPLFYILLFEGLSWDQLQLTALRRMTLILLFAQSAVVVVYPLIIGHTQLYLAGANGLFKGFNLFFGLGATLPYADPDWNRGTLVDAHQLGFLLALLAAYAFASVRHPRRIVTLMAGAGLLSLFGITETAHAVPSLLTGLVLMAVARWYTRRRRKVKLLRLALFSTAVALPIAFAVIIYSGDTWFARSNKAILFEQTIKLMQEEPLNAVFGQGPAAFGSRVANKRLPRSFHAPEYPVPFLIEEHVNEDYARVLQEAQKGIGGNTAEVQASGLVATAGEFGLVGNAFLLIFLFAVFSRRLPSLAGDTPSDVAMHGTGVFAFIFLAGALCFRQYLEYPQIMSFFWLFLLFPTVSRPKGGEVLEELHVQNPFSRIRGSFFAH